jgi:hypothetical protein
MFSGERFCRRAKPVKQASGGGAPAGRSAPATAIKVDHHSGQLGAHLVYGRDYGGVVGVIAFITDRGTFNLIRSGLDGGNAPVGSAPRRSTGVRAAVCVAGPS